MPEGAVFEAVDGQGGGAVGVLCREFLVDFHAVARGIAGMQIAVVEAPGAREYGIGFFGVAHVFLDAEVGHGQIEVERGAHAYR